MCVCVCQLASENHMCMRLCVSVCGGKSSQVWLPVCLRITNSPKKTFFFFLFFATLDLLSGIRHLLTSSLSSDVSDEAGFGSFAKSSFLDFTNLPYQPLAADSFNLLVFGRTPPLTDEPGLKNGWFVFRPAPLAAWRSWQEWNSQPGRGAAVHHAPRHTRMQSRW